jgi:hypothetical protein
MKHSVRVGIGFVLIALLTGCAQSLPSVKMKFDQGKGMPLETTAASYTNTYFQARFMGLKPILVGPVLWYAGGSYEGRKSQRIEDSDFEKLLGDFDVFEYFNKELAKHATDTGTVKMQFTESPEVTSRVVNIAKCDNNDECMKAVRSLGATTPNIAAFKMAYGLGSRQGGEQFGFRKYYRPFIRLIGVIKSMPSAEAIWQTDILVFSDNRYLGSEADADQIPRVQLVSSFKSLTTQVIDLLVRSLNGETLQEMPIMVDTAASDLQF